jgi:tetratricopeptide (TPR) repeat protein
LSQSKYISTDIRDEIIDLTKADFEESLSYYLIPLPETTRDITYKVSDYKEEYKQVVDLENSIENEEDGRKDVILGNIYYYQGNYDLAEKYYLQASKEGIVSAMYNLAWIYYTKNKNKEQVKKYIDRYERKNFNKIIIEIWAGVFNKVEERVVTVCKEENENAEFLERLLIHHQKSLIDKLFHHAEFGKRLQEQYMVLYYASQILNGKEKENNLRLRIPPELHTTVENVLKSIKEEQKRYYA